MKVVLLMFYFGSSLSKLAISYPNYAIVATLAKVMSSAYTKSGFFFSLIANRKDSYIKKANSTQEYIPDTMLCKRNSLLQGHSGLSS